MAGIPDGTVRLDGSMGEGGGQILRTALSLSVITGRPLALENIRGRRSPPGLRPQHVQAVVAAARVGAAATEGAEVGARRLRFAPTARRTGDFQFDIGTAGCTGLVLQTVYLPLALSGRDCQVTITGGTHVPDSPGFHYLDGIWRPALAAMGVGIDLRLERAGFYPRGGGSIHAWIRGVDGVTAFEQCARGALVRVAVRSMVANLDTGIARRQARQALRRLGRLDAALTTEVATLPAASPGTLLMLTAEFEHARAGFCAVGERGKSAERVADEAADALLAFIASDGAVDAHLADQLLLPMALADGPGRLCSARITPHLETNAAVIRAFLPVDIRLHHDNGLVEVFPMAHEGV